MRHYVKYLTGCTLLMAVLNTQGQIPKKNSKDIFAGTFDVKQISFTPWDMSDGIPFWQMPGGDLGATSFHVLDDKEIAFLCGQSEEIRMIDRLSGKVIKRFSVLPFPRNFVYDKGLYYVLGGKQEGE